MADNLNLRHILEEENPFDEEDDGRVDNDSDDEDHARDSALPMDEQLFAIVTPSPQNEVYGPGTGPEDGEDSDEEDNEQPEMASQWKVESAYGEPRLKGQLLHARCPQCLVLDI